MLISVTAYVLLVQACILSYGLQGALNSNMSLVSMFIITHVIDIQLKACVVNPLLRFLTSQCVLIAQLRYYEKFIHASGDMIYFRDCERKVP